MQIRGILYGRYRKKGSIWAIGQISHETLDSIVEKLQKARGARASHSTGYRMDESSDWTTHHDGFTIFL